jgi:hypothetical protein
MRQTGRTSRIAQFAVDQLKSVGQVIVTDHIAFENVRIGRHNLGHLIKNVEMLYSISNHQDISVAHEIHETVRGGGILFVHFWLETNSQFNIEWMKIKNNIKQ